MKTLLLNGRMFARRAYDTLINSIDGFVRGEADFEKAKFVIPFFYYFLFFIAFSHLEGLTNTISQGGNAFVARLPLIWSSGFEYATIVTIVYIGWTATALLAAAFPYVRTARILAFIGLLEYHAYVSSFGGPNHQWDHWLWIAFILIFLPTLTSTPTSETRKTFSLVFWSAQAFLLLTYSMAGVGKLFFGVIQFLQGQANVFLPDAAALYAATQLNQMHETVPLANLIIYNPWIAWIPFLLILELQTFAILAAFRPQTHRLWGLGLILFHIGTFLTMRAVFTLPSALLLLFLVASPFTPEIGGWRPALRATPLLGILFRRIEKALTSKPRLLS